VSHAHRRTRALRQQDAALPWRGPVARWTRTRRDRVRPCRGQRKRRRHCGTRSGPESQGACSALAQSLTMRVLVTRPLDDSLDTAVRLKLLGHEAVIAPLLEI